MEVDNGVSVCMQAVIQLLAVREMLERIESMKREEREYSNALLQLMS